jgi:hypothetical protein
MTLRKVAFVGIATFLAITAQAASQHLRHIGTHDDGGTDGGPGKMSDVTRTIRIEARDTAFNVKEIRVKAGETIKIYRHQRRRAPARIRHRQPRGACGA